jgi:FKBP12-rapamycin complex-associated protein
VESFGANAAWMLGDWGAMDTFIAGYTSTQTSDVILSSNPLFYKAVMAIHSRQYEQAMSLIEDTRYARCFHDDASINNTNLVSHRSTLAESISTLMSENYSRAYRAMMSMQILSELEEVVEYKVMN